MISLLQLQLGIAWIFLSLIGCIFIDLVLTSWVYNDAKGRASSNAGLWAAFTFFFFVLGFLLYLLVGRKSEPSGTPSISQEGDLSGRLASYPQASPAVGSGLKFCPYCGRQLKKDYLFCGECGKRLEEPVAPPPKPAPPPEVKCAKCGNIARFNAARRSLFCDTCENPDTHEHGVRICPVCGGQNLRYIALSDRFSCKDCDKDATVSGQVEATNATIASKHEPIGSLSIISIALSIVGLAIFGGLFLEVPALIMAVVGGYKGEKAGALAVFISVACIMFSFVLGRLFLMRLGY